MTFFDVSNSILIQLDVSNSGQGAALLQELKPVGYVSISLPVPDKNYAIIKKELLAALFDY